MMRTVPLGDGKVPAGAMPPRGRAVADGAFAGHAAGNGFDPGRPDPAEPDPDRLDLGEVRRFLARRWRLVLAVAAGCAAAALAVCLVMTPVYTATTQILLDPHRAHAFGQETVQPDAALDSSIVDSQISILTSTRLLATVIEKEHLATDPEFAAAARPGLLARLIGLFRGARPAPEAEPDLDGIDPKLAPVIAHLSSRIEVTRVAKSYVLSVSVSSRDPAKAMRLANALSESFVADRVEVHARTVQQAATFFEERLGSLRDQLRQSERAVADFRKAHDLLATTTDGQVNISEQQLQDLNQQLAIAGTDTAEKLARYEQAKRFRDAGGAVDTLPDVVRSAVVVALRSQQADLLRRAADLAATYGPQYPAITQIRAQQQGLDRAVAVEIRRLVAASRNDYEVAAAREAALRRTVSRLTDTSGGNEIGVKLRELERTAQANRALFENFLNRAKLAQEQSTFEEPDARLISPALEPTAPTTPKTKLIVPVGGIAGLVIGLALAALADRGRAAAPPVEAPAQEEAPADGPAPGGFILGELPPAGPGLAGAAALLDLSAPGHDGTYARAVADLAERLRPPVGGARTLLVVEPRDGGETAPLGDTAAGVVLALAAAMARRGVRVLAVDAAAGALSRACGAADAPGLAAVMGGALAAEEALIPLPGLPADSAVLPRGRGAVPDAELMDFLGEARRFYDVVLVAAGLATAAGEAVAATADAGIVLVASPDAPAAFVAAVDAIAERPRFLGLVLTAAAAASPERAIAG